MGMFVVGRPSRMGDGSRVLVRAAGRSGDDYLAFALQVKALSRLHELALALAGMPEPQPALQAILETLVEVHSADFGVLSLYDESSGGLAPAASFGFDEDALEAISRINPGPKDGACGSAFSTKARAVVQDVNVDDRFECYRGFAQAVGFRAVHSTPIITKRGEAVGVLSVHFRDVRLPSDMEMQMADLCALHAADAMDVAKSRQALR